MTYSIKKIGLFCGAAMLLSAQAIVAQTLTLEDIFASRKFAERSVYGINWTQSGGYYSELNNNSILKKEVSTGKLAATILSANNLNPKISIQDYEISSDESQIVLSTDIEPIYRRSFTAQYYIYNIGNSTLSPVSQNGRQSYATLSPDGKKVAFVRENNLFFVDLENKTETQITSDGKLNELIHGSTDWVYEEEFGFAKAFFWSPDSKKIAFYTFDEKHVKEYNMQMWGEDLYPIDYKFKYPKAGEDNSFVSISIYHLDSKKTQAVNVPAPEGKDFYIPRINWTASADLLSIRKLNRLQNHLQLFHADAQTGACTLVLEEKSDTYVDIEYNDILIYLDDNQGFIMASEQDGYKHLYHYTLEGKLIRQITKGQWEVDEFIGFDKKNNKIYFTSTEVSPIERHFYVVDFDGNNKKKISTLAGVNHVEMSKDFSYFINFHSSSTSPKLVTLHKTSDFSQIAVLEDNAALKKTLSSYKLATKEHFSFKTSDGQTLNGFMLKPADFKPKNKYPVLMYVYGGPGSQNVKNEWAGGNFYWHQYLAQNGYVVVCVDNRGTNGRGKAFKTATYANLGKFELQDQIDGAKYLATLPYVDKNRIGIWGWSYGGYMSSLAIMKGAEFFKAAIAVAPVTTWRYYDSIYTERFLKRPQDNAAGYDENSPINFVKNLKGKYLLIHGTADDNVHFQNAVMLQDALINANKQFDSFYYPNKNHGIYGGYTRLHLFTMMTNFILTNL